MFSQIVRDVKTFFKKKHFQIKKNFCDRLLRMRSEVNERESHNHKIESGITSKTLNIIRKEPRCCGAFRGFHRLMTEG